MNAFSVIQKNELMSKIFHILLSIAPFRVLKISDVQVLKYLGFQKALNELTPGAPLDPAFNNDGPAKSNLDPSLSAVASTSGGDSTIKGFPKCMSDFILLRDHL